MHSQLTESARKRPSAATSDRCDAARHEHSERSVIRCVVVLSGKGVHRADLINESLLGLGLRYHGAHVSTQVGDVVEVIYRGQRRRAQVRHLTPDPSGTLVGIEWQPVYAK